MDQLCFEEGYRLFLYWRILEVFFSSFYFWCFVWHLVTHAILSFSYANRNSYYFWNALMLTLFHARTIFSLLHKFCIRVTFFLILQSHLKESTTRRALGQCPESAWNKWIRTGNTLGQPRNFAHLSWFLCTMVWGSKSYTWVSDCVVVMGVGVDAPNPYIFQGSTVFIGHPCPSSHALEHCLAFKFWLFLFMLTSSFTKSDFSRRAYRMVNEIKHILY